jgi:hypothetical protein
VTLAVMRRALASLMAGVLAASAGLEVAHGQSGSDARIDSHAYYLFVARRPDSCEECYVPLLVTSKRLEDVANDKLVEHCVVITTFERDSIVGVPRDVTVAGADVKPQERHLRLQDREYRYQEIGASEVLRLLEHPSGTIPISRIPEMQVPSAAELASLITRFRTGK